MTDTFVNPDKIDILTRNYGTNSENAQRDDYQTRENTHKNTKNRQTFWTKIVSKVQVVWEKIKPVIRGLTIFFTVTASFVKAGTKFCTQCKNLKGVFA